MAKGKIFLLIIFFNILLPVLGLSQTLSYQNRLDDIKNIQSISDQNSVLDNIMQIDQMLGYETKTISLAKDAVLKKIDSFCKSKVDDAEKVKCLIRILRSDALPMRLNRSEVEPKIFSSVYWLCFVAAVYVDTGLRQLGFNSSKILSTETHAFNVVKVYNRYDLYIDMSQPYLDNLVYGLSNLGSYPTAKKISKEEANIIEQMLSLQEDNIARINKITLTPESNKNFEILCDFDALTYYVGTITPNKITDSYIYVEKLLVAIHHKNSALNPKVLEQCSTENFSRFTHNFIGDLIKHSLKKDGEDADYILSLYDSLQGTKYKEDIDQQYEGKFKEKVKDVAKYKRLF